MEMIPSHLKLTVNIAALEDIQKEKEPFTQQADHPKLDLPIFTEDLAFKYLNSPTQIDVKIFHHFGELYIPNAPILIKNPYFEEVCD